MKITMGDVKTVRDVKPGQVFRLNGEYWLRATNPNHPQFIELESGLTSSLMGHEGTAVVVYDAEMILTKPTE